MTELKYDVVALSLPVVFNGDGDHDRNGMLYTLKAYRPLLEWARDRWYDHDEYLPGLHRKILLMRILVDGLERYEAMRRSLAGAGPEVIRLLDEYGGEEEVERRADLDDRLDGDVHAVHGISVTAEARALAIRQNYRDTVDDIVIALTELTGGWTRSIDPDPAVRAQWRSTWQASLASAELGVEEWLSTIDEAGGAPSPRRFDAGALAERTGPPGQRLSAEQVRRLLLNDHTPRARAAGSPRYDRFNPMKPVPLMRPLVLRARHGDTVTVTLENQVGRTGDADRSGPRRVGLHLQGAGLAGEHGAGVLYGDGASVGANPDTTVPYRQKRTFRWTCPHEGTWLFNDLADIRGSERGSNAHGLFGALIVEPAGTTWRDPETGEVLTGTPWGDGLDVDIMVPGERPGTPEHLDFVDFHSDDVPRSHREFTVFLHDEPDVHSPIHRVHAEHAVMPVSYRAEPMPNRVPHALRRLAARTSAAPDPDQDGIDLSAVRIELNDELSEVFHIGRRPDGGYVEIVAGEEQHHSSWLFGEPATTVHKAYRGDPVRLRLFHAGVKETHVYHLHTHQWRAVAQEPAPPSAWRPEDRTGTQILDSITIGPQSSFTIDPLYGSGSRQQAVGDIIWHCHLYPHFHHGMWGMWRSFDRRVDGTRPYPDGTPSTPLAPLPGREPPPSTEQAPGFPWFVPGPFPRKSPPPPAIRDEDVTGRRRMLGMPTHTPAEYAAFDPGCVANPRQGAVFVDLDAQARAWNQKAGLPPPRVLSYDVEVSTERIEYNSDGWHDRNGHVYRLSGISVTQLDEDGAPGPVERFDPPTGEGAEAFFPRANHGDIVEWRMHNRFTAYPADHFDLGVPAVECGLHVHLVKFDVLAADGSCTGWNYLSGASAPDMVPDQPGPGLEPNVGLHRWVVDEEFGPVFFHDHLLANFRQKRGLSGALIAETHGSTWLDPAQQETAWSSAQAVIVPPPKSGLPAYRDVGLNIGDFVPLYDRHDEPLNEPNRLGGVSDPGVMGVNLRNSPLYYRGDDPSLWFSSTEPEDPQVHPERRPGEPDTAVIDTYPGERLRIRLLQGSHEEQHSFMVHGMRWRPFWHPGGEEAEGWRRGAPPLTNQQTLGISEAFTLEVDPARDGPYGPGDHLWAFSVMDDLWLGCWGYVRAHLPSAAQLGILPPLPDPARSREQVVERITAARVPDAPLRRGVGWTAPVREYVVRARRIEHRYDGDALTDPWGLIFETAEGWQRVLHEDGTDSGHRRATGVRTSDEPLVLRARRGEWVRVILINEVLTPDRPDGARQVPFGPELSPPRLPVEHRDRNGFPDRRTVSPRVSLHPNVLLYDVVGDDGAFVGRNRDGTAAPLVDLDAGFGAHGAHGGHAAGGGGGVEHRGHHGGHLDENWREYWWYADEALAPASAADGTGQICYLQDMGDVRNHRHHGLFGALVVLPGDATPLDPETGEERWTGVSATVRAGDAEQAHERVLFLQDGLRHFRDGNPRHPLPDYEPGIDPVDAGQKGMNYRSARPGDHQLAWADPPTPVFEARRGDTVWFRIAGASDKPRNHSFTVHGHAWPDTPWLDGAASWTGSLSGISAGSTRDLVLVADEPGDHAYRSGVFRWHLNEGMWGILRVREDGAAGGGRPGGHVHRPRP